MPALLVCLAALAAEPAAVRLTPRTALVFAGVEQGRAVLGSRDVYVESTSPLERQIRLASEEEVSVEQFLHHAQEQVLAWPPDEAKRLSAVAGSLRDKLAGLDLPLPDEVLLIRTTGKEESGAAYTRENAIVFPQGRLGGRVAALERLLAHELFHVLSRHDPALRRKLYALIGFRPCGPVALPDELAAIKLTNPDAPTIDYCIAIEHEGEQLHAVPVLLSNREQYDPRARRLFDYLSFKLMAVRQRDGRWRPLLRDGRPLLIDGRTNASYRRQIGENTGYIIHPDEILADNFAHLAMGTKELPSPEIVARMRTILEAAHQETKE